jgi:DNA-binding CsgD family transcriptional regulator
MKDAVASGQDVAPSTATRPRIVVIGATPLLAEGARAALATDARWQVMLGTSDDPADAWVQVGNDVVLRTPLGTSAQLSADAPAARLRAAVGAVLEGLNVREAPSAAMALDHEPLTAREIEVFELLAKGLSNRDIGGVLGISAHTAKYHVAQILAKVGAATRAEAVREGLRAGVIGL